ncbi:cellulose-binding domain-containing protein [Heterostelium album PN500]|uniref:Cellulose-binding domain-containing protein n=1 Tax=Heterostelium pallidum (strain ATCC 26659 / Pp 5 / PN500) TaxID=670386 RepID=D3BAS8_HETP5|nr:cellulose-binding domain-containing protein [Heterostelium album PN500]EFA81665.1 cellulose-binding domain-containing protein [Heterostelium album PN500]|eukprot:XP_020433782.1 cellulose-binding domain-containing protein [Heterostelium album PN500]
MKLIGLFCTLLICVAFVSANELDNSDLHISQKVIGTWTDGSRGNRQYTQYDVTVTNVSHRNIKNFFIDTDYTFRVRDGTAYWNVVRLPNGDLTLPSYQTSINAGASYTFGFILLGSPSSPANLQVGEVHLTRSKEYANKNERNQDSLPDFYVFTNKIGDPTKSILHYQKKFDI